VMNDLKVVVVVVAQMNDQVLVVGADLLVIDFSL